jgi:hypothetical protein
MKDDRALSLFGMRDEDIHRAVLNTDVASVAYFRIEDCGSAWCSYVWLGINSHSILRLSGSACPIECKK